MLVGDRVDRLPEMSCYATGRKLGRMASQQANEVQRLVRTLVGNGATRLPEMSCAWTGRRLGCMASQ